MGNDGKMSECWTTEVHLSLQASSSFLLPLAFWPQDFSFLLSFFFSFNTLVHAGLYGPYLEVS